MIATHVQRGTFSRSYAFLQESLNTPSCYLQNFQSHSAFSSTRTNLQQITSRQPAFPCTTMRHRSGFSTSRDRQGCSTAHSLRILEFFDRRCVSTWSAVHRQFLSVCHCLPAYRKATFACRVVASNQLKGRYDYFEFKPNGKLL